MTLLGRAHGRVHDRRVRVLSMLVADALPRDARTLDVGCGDGLLARRVMDRRPDVAMEGIDVLVRHDARVPVRAFDGMRIPFPDRSVDAVCIVDVLHHTDDPLVLLREAARVASAVVVIKDHLADRPLARATLRAMDWVGNARHGVALPYNYWTRARWMLAIADAGLAVERWNERVPLYPAPLSWAFGGSLHFVAHLVPSAVPRVVPRVVRP